MYLGIDFGKKRIGLALGCIYPKGLGIIENKNDYEEAAEEISKICQENEVEAVVIGCPIRLSGEEGCLVKEIKEFAEVVSQKTGLKVFFEPEQFTSLEAERILKEQDVKYTRKSGTVDELAAVLILEQYINSLRNKNGK